MSDASSNIKPIINSFNYRLYQCPPNWEENSCIGVEITSKSHTEVLLFSSENKIDFGDIQLQAKWISAVKDSAGNIVKTTSYGST